MINTKKFENISNKQRLEVENIFYSSSTKSSFRSDDERTKFKYKYLDYYIENYPDIFIVAVRDESVVGYICGSPDSSKDIFLGESLSHYNLFRDEYLKYPAHLHINLCQSSRGLGLGSILIKEFENLVSLTSSGVHLLTSPIARNRSFYLKNHYNFEITKSFNNSEILLMGKLLSY
jgi:GNAT superfamily N-acetyltransferase